MRLTLLIPKPDERYCENACRNGRIQKVDRHARRRRIEERARIKAAERKKSTRRLIPAVPVR